MNAFGKGLLNYAVQVAASIVVGTIVGSLVGIAVRWRSAGVVSREEILATINGSIFASTSVILVLTGIGVLPVKGRNKS